MVKEKPLQKNQTFLSVDLDWLSRHLQTHDLFQDDMDDFKKTIP